MYKRQGHEYDEEVADHAQAIIKSINAQVLNIEEIEKQKAQSRYELLTSTKRNLIKDKFRQIGQPPNAEREAIRKKIDDSITQQLKKQNNETTT